MKVEQACRFRLDGGYCIFAKSEGFGPQQEKGLQDIFNDSMNPIFPKMGASILTCTTGKTDAFFARNTLRTDIHGRMTIFTHAYSMAAEDYTRLMKEQPQLLLSVSLNRLLETQSQGVEMEQLDLTQYAQPLELDALLRKYDLNPGRYSRLLLGAYEALTSNQSLRLKTNRSLEESEQMVREITYCVLAGLLNVLKGRVTFSSGADTRMSISVCCAGCSDIRSSDLVFGVDDDRETNIRPRDEITAQTFQALGAMGHAQRLQTLEQMEQWLSGITNVNEGISLAMICAAYFLSSGRGMNLESILTLFKSFCAAAGKAVPVKVADDLLTSLLVTMNENGVCNSQSLSQVALWYLQESSPEFRAQADIMLRRAPEDICAALVDAALQQPMTDNVRQMLRLLLQVLPPDSQELELETQEDLVRWIVRENESEYMKFCAAAIGKFTMAHMRNLVAGILEDAAQRPFVGAEDAVLVRALEILAEAGSTADAVLPEAAIASLDGHMAGCSGPLQESAARYFLRSRLAAFGTVEEKLQALSRLEQLCPDFVSQLEQLMEAGFAGTADLWEHYQTERCFAENMTVEELARTCRACNTFQNPEGPFETRAAGLWYKCVKAQLSVMKKDNETTLAQLSERIMQYLEGLESMNLSDTVRSKMGNSAINAYWAAVSYRHIYTSNYYVPKRLQRNLPNAALKLPLIDLCAKFSEKPTDARGFIQLITQQEPDSPQLTELQSFLYGMASRTAVSKKFMSWDLLLLACWKGGEEYDLEKFMDLADAVHKQLVKAKLAGRIRSKAMDSQLLTNAALRKNVAKLGAYEISPLLEEMVQELKNNKRAPEPEKESPRPGRTANSPYANSSYGRPSEPARPARPGMQELPRRDDQGSKGGLFGWKGKK